MNVEASQVPEESTFPAWFTDIRVRGSSARTAGPKSSCLTRVLVDRVCR